MKRLLQSLTLVLALVLGMNASAQMSAYTFSTGEDASAWLSVDNETQIVASSVDDGVSGLQNLGFTFPFCGENYTQFSANSNGRIRLGSTAISNEYGVPFNSSYYTGNLPKIAVVGKDLYSGTNGYVKYGTTTVNGETVGVVNFHLNTTASNTSNYFDAQIQLFESGKIRLVYGAVNGSCSSFHVGIGGPTAGDIAYVNTSNHTAAVATGALSTTNSTWPGENRYYQFQVSACPPPSAVTAVMTSGSTANVTWNAMPSVTSWYVLTSATQVASPSVDDATVVTTPPTPSPASPPARRSTSMSPPTAAARLPSGSPPASPSPPCPFLISLGARTSPLTMAGSSSMAPRTTSGTSPMATSSSPTTAALPTPTTTAAFATPGPCAPCNWPQATIPSATTGSATAKPPGTMSTPSSCPPA